MAQIWKIQLNDNSVGGLGAQDITKNVDVTTMKLVPTTWDQLPESSMKFFTPISGAPDIAVDSFMELTAGIWNTTTNVWDSAIYGGFIIKHKGHTEGGIHFIDITLQGYNILWDTTAVIAWPSPAGTVDFLASFPKDQTVFTWISGQAGSPTPYDGLLPFHFEETIMAIDNSGYDTTLRDIMITADILPGNSSILGQWGFISLRKAMDDLMGAIKFKYPDYRPVYYFEPAPLGSGIRPRFRLANMWYDATSPDIQLSDDPDNITTFAYEDFSHERDASTTQTRIDVSGTSGDPAEDYALIWATAAVTAHLEKYPSVYQLRPGWAGAPIVEPKLQSLAQARIYANSAETIMWGPRGYIKASTRKYAAPGMTASIINTVETLDGSINYPINQTEIDFSNPNSPKYIHSIGHRPRTLADIFLGGTNANGMIGDAPDNGGGGADTNTIAGIMPVPGIPRSIPIVTFPGHTERNVIVPATYQTVGIDIMPSQNGIPTPIPVPLNPSNPFQVSHLYTDPITGHTTKIADVWIDWGDVIGDTPVLRPNYLPFDFKSASTQEQVLPDRMKFFRHTLYPSTLPSGATITYQITTPTGTMTTNITISSPGTFVPFNGKKGDMLTVIIAGTTATFLVTVVG